MTMGSSLARVIATWFGCGYAPKAPGTVGSAAAIAIALVLHQYAGFGAAHFAVLSVLVFGPFVWAAGRTASDLKLEDPQIVVADEVIGVWVALAGARAWNWKTWLAAFVLFRLFDIWKPAPVRQCERFPGGYGIIADDVMAGMYAALVLFLAGCFNLY
jgi:phosphatidylglycerophosphatase A